MNRGRYIQLAESYRGDFFTGGLAQWKADYESQLETAANAHEQARQRTRSDPERAALDREYEQKRAQLTRAYEVRRRAVLGWPPARQGPAPAVPTTRPTPASIVR